MIMTSLFLLVSLLTGGTTFSVDAATEGGLLARSYKPKLTAINVNVLNGAYLEAARLFERQDCGGTQCPGKTLQHE